MNLSHLVGRRQPNYCDVAAWYADRVILSNLKDCSLAARPAVSKDQLCQLVRTRPLRHEFTLLAGAPWIFLRRVESEAIPMRRREPA